MNGTSFPSYGGYKRFRPGKKVRFSCLSQRFQMIGQETITCLKSGKWSDPKPSCIGTSLASIVDHKTILLKYNQRHNE